MPVDPNILLNVRTPNAVPAVSNALLSGQNIRANNEQRDSRNRLLSANAGNAETTAAYQEAIFQLSDAAQDALMVRPALESGDIQTAVNRLNQRILKTQDRGTVRIRDGLLSGEIAPSQALSEIDTVINTANQFGVLGGGDQGLTEYQRQSLELQRQRLEKGPPSTASQSDYEYYKKLKQDNPEEAEIFGKQAGFISSEGDELSSYYQKRLGEANDEAVQSSAAARNYQGLAQDFERLDPAAGSAATFAEALKSFTGSEDAVSRLRQEYRQIRNTEAVKNLPPGVASDKDIELALSGFPKDTSNPEYIASFMRGLSKLAKARADYNDFKAQYISENGTERDFLKAWKAFARSKAAAEGGGTKRLRFNPETGRLE